MLRTSCRHLCGVIPQWRRAPLVSVGAGKLRARPRRGAHAPHPIPHRQQERTGGRAWEVGTPRSWGRATPFSLSFLPGCCRSPWEATLLGLGLHRGRRASCSAGHRADPLKMGNSAEDVAGTSHTRAPSVRLGSPGGAARPRERSSSSGGQSRVLRGSGTVSSPRRPPQPGEPRRHPPRKGTPREPRVPAPGRPRAGATCGVSGSPFRRTRHRQTRKSMARRGPDECWEPGV